MPQHDESTTDQDLLAAVREEVLAYGVRRATATSIAARAGVSRMTVYRRGGGVKQLVLDALSREFETQIAEVVSGARGETVRETLGAWAAASAASATIDQVREQERLYADLRAELTRAFDVWAAEQGLRMQRIVASNSLMAIVGLTLADVYAMADYAVPDDLPSFRPYLRTKYRDLPADDVEAIERYAARLAKKHGINLDGPAPGEDES